MLRSTRAGLLVTAAKLGNARVISDQKYRTDNDAGKPMPDGWLSWLGRWVAKLIARMLTTAGLWVPIQTSLKNTKMGNISKGVSNTL
jgi:hypothetical protein